MNTIQIGRRTYTVTTQTATNGELQYVLTGVRGAQYVTMRNAHRPEMMFLLTPDLGRGRTIWLTDKDGTLRTV